MAELKYLTGAVLMLKLSFLHPISPKSLIKKCFYLIWGFFYFLSLVLTFLQCALYLYDNPFDLIDEAMVVMNTVIYFSLFVNFTFLCLKSGKLSTLIRNINDNFIDESDNKMDVVKMADAAILADKVAYYWSINCVASSLMPTISLLIGGQMVLPVLAWFPYDSENSPFFELTYIWQIFCIINLGVIYAVLDLVFPCIAILMGQQLKILASNFQNCVYRALIDAEVPKYVVDDFKEKIAVSDYNEAIFTGSTNFEEKNFSYLAKNIEHHQLLLKYCDDLNDILGTFLMGKISAAIFNTLFMAFSLITTGDGAMVFGLASYVMSTSIELLIYTYSGQILTENADRLLWTLYESPWYFCDLKFQKMIHIVQMRVSKTVQVKAGNYFSMTAAQYITFMKALGSYVALLKELTDRRK